MALARIMVVEDEGIVALDIQNKLEGLGYEVPEVASSGELAIQLAGEVRPDLIMMDIQLDGEMDGVEAAEQIRQRFDIPVIYLTAFSDENTLQRAKISEPFGYLLKPFAERELHTAIEVAIYKYRVEEEKARLETQLRQAQKMEAIGQLTAGIAHNFNNMLHGILGNLDLALMSAPDELKPFLEAAEFDGQKAAQLVKQFMLFFWQEQGEREPVRIAALIEDVAAMGREIFSRKSPRKIEIAVKSDLDLPPVYGNPAQFRQCFTNLCLNAQEALEHLPAVAPPRSPYIEIEVSSVNFNSDDRIPSPQASPGQYIRVRVADNGVGMDQETRERIFEPFFSTKEEGQGTGLGLAMVYAIVKEHNGWIECDSAPGSGTTFTVNLPAGTHDARPSEATEALEPEIITGEEAKTAIDSLHGTEPVLVIADVDRFRRILTEMLERHGYEVLLGINIRDGLNVFQHEKERMGLVILDLSAPGASSQELLAELLAIDPGARVLVVTGYATSGSAWQ